MGDSAGKPADGFHLLRHAKLFFQDALLAHVFGKHFKARGSALFVIDVPARTAHDDGRLVLLLPLHFNVFHFFRARQMFRQSLVFAMVNEYVGGQVFSQEILFLLIAEHFSERGVDLEQSSRDACAVNSVGRVFHHGSEVRLGTLQGFLGSFAFRGVAIHDHQFFRLPFSVANDAGAGLQHEPGAVLVLEAILQCFPDSRLPRLLGGSLNTFAIIGMDLLEGRGRLQFFRRIAKDSLVGKAVKKTLSMHVYNSDHVGGVLANQVKQLFTLNKLSADAVNQKMLIDGIEVKQENQCHQTAHGL